MRAILITKDGINITHLNGDDTLQAIRKAIDCRMVASAGEPMPNVAAWIDDEGKLTEPDVVHQVAWHTDVLAGNILLTGLDPMGNTASTKITVNQVKQWVLGTFTRYVVTTKNTSGELVHVKAYARSVASAMYAFQIPEDQKLVEVLTLTDWESKYGQED